jgi:protocatechuate 3,4-dioxygenase beta subunit
MGVRRLSRRDLLDTALGLGVVTSTLSLAPAALAQAMKESAAARKPTPRVELGPFYKRNAPKTSDMRAPGDPGLPLSVTGTVYGSRGDALPGATVEVWQTNHLGLYDLDGDHYRALLESGADAVYTFGSVMPGHYPDRVCQHIHYLVHAPGHKPLVTQLYFATDPVFEGDPDKNFRKDPLVTSRELVRPVTLTGDPKDVRAAVRFDVVLERA